MKELTSRQQEFLLFFSTSKDNKKWITDAAIQFKVSKPTVFNIIETLEELKFVVKNNNREIVFTEYGLEFVKNKIEICKKIQKWLESDLGLTPITAEFEARKMIVTLEENTISSLINYFDENKEINVSDINKGKLNILENIDYEVPFKVYKSNKIDISMGDRGFIKPAIFKRIGNDIQVFLYTHNMKYISKKRNRLEGSLDRLWYASNNKWYEAEISKDGYYAISEEALIFNENQKTCELKIRARATVSYLKMPESEAVIIFDLEEIVEKEKV